MKHKSLFLFGCALTLLSGSGTESHAQGDGTPKNGSQEVIGANLTQNGSFENNAAFWVLPTGAAVDRREVHLGSAALHVTNQAPAQTRVVTQFIPASPGHVLTASAWIKGRGANQGVSIALEAFDASGARLGGMTSPANSGTFDWKQIRIDYTVPANADKVFLRLIPGEGTEGDVWFDDTTVNIVSGGPQSDNILPNPGFEEGLGNYEIYPFLKELLQRDTEIKHSGAFSLRASNDNPEVYVLTSQKVGTFLPGDILHISAWIKGENMTPDTSRNGAAIFLEFYDANNKWLAGNYPPPLRGTFDWTYVSGKLEVPTGATRVNVGMRQHKGTTGTTWFDDLSLQVEKRNTLRVYFQSPNYRGLISGSEKTWRALAQVNPAPDWKDATLPLESRIFDAEGKTIAQTTLSVPATSGEHAITVSPPANLPDGPYYWRLNFPNISGKAERFQQPLLKTASAPAVGIDAEGFTVTDGERFFPLGLFLANGTNSEADLQRIAKAGYNTVLSYSYGFDKDYEAFLDMAQRNNLKVIFSLKDMLIPRAGLDQATLDATITDRVVKLRNKPALLAWYINDEKPMSYVPTLESVYSRVKGLDPDHPTYQVLDQTRYLDYYYSSSDILGTDPYPIEYSSPNTPGTAPSPVGKYNDLQISTQLTQDTVAAARQSKAVWMVPQVMDYGVYPNRTSHSPSVQEMRNQAYQAIIAGAKGLVFYSYFDLYYTDHQRELNQSALEKRWPGVAQLAADVNAVIPAVLNGIPVPLSLPATVRVRASAIQFNNQLLVLAANPYPSAESITINIPAGWKLAKAQQNDVTGALQGNSLTLSLPPLGSGVFALDPA